MLKILKTTYYLGERGCSITMGGYLVILLEPDGKP